MKLTPRGLVALALTLWLPAVSSTRAATIAFSAPATIAGDTDVATNGTLKYAYHWATGNQSVNDVAFTGTTSTSSGGSDVTLSGFTSYYGAFTGTTTPFTGLSTAYRATLAGSPYTAQTPATVTLGNLTAGRTYVVQVWLNDSRIYGQGRAATLASAGGSTVTLDYNSKDTSNADGGVGQYSVGTFTADATTQTFSITPIAGTGNGAGSSAQLNALQLRDLSPPPALAITTQPLGQEATAGSTVTFSVVASSTLPVAYQWSLNGTPLPAATNDSLVLDNVGTNHAGYYTVRVSNAVTNLLSSPAWLTVVPAIDPLNPAVALDAYNTLWTSPSQNDRGAMPLGNGEVGLMLWVEADGDLQFYLARTDSRTELDRLVKLGKVRLRLSPNPFATGQPFRQQLRLRDGRVDITAGPPTNQVALQVFVDSDSPTVHVAGTSASAVSVTAIYETWRTQDYTGNANDSPLGGSGYPNLYESADVVDASVSNRLVFYHRNAWSCVPQTAGFQFMSPYLNDIPDPLTNRTFGGWMTLTGASVNGSNALATALATTNFNLKIATHTAQTPTAGDWLAQVAATNAVAPDATTAAQRTAQWWSNYWNRSWLFIQGDAVSSTTTPMGVNALALRLGADSSGANKFTGSMARGSFFNRALTAGEVASLAQGAPDADAAVTNGLVESWLLGGTTGGVCVGRRGTGLDLSVAGTVTVITNSGVKRAQFDGGYFAGLDDARLEPNAGVTMEAWIYLDAGETSAGRLFDKVTPNQQDGYLFDMYPGRALRFLNGADGVSTAGNYLNTNVWLHVVASYDNVSKAKALYLNGTLAAQSGGAVPDEPTPSAVTRAYVLTKWMTACGGRGNFPIMFNGSLWTVNQNTSPISISNNPDFRNWGHTYFYQNTRLYYLSMCARDELEFLRPLFTYYDRFQALNRGRAIAWHGAEGQFNNEMTTSFGLTLGGIYGYNRSGKPNWYTDNQWGGAVTISPGLELLALQLDYYDHSGDTAYLQSNTVPYAKDLFRFIETRYTNRVAGRINLYPVHSVETFWNTTNSMPVVAGMNAVLDRLLALPSGLLTVGQSNHLAGIKAMTPPLPLQQVNGQTVFAPAQVWTNTRQNVEVPELYAIFPFRLSGYGRTNLDLGRNSFQQIPVNRGYFKPFTIGGPTYVDSFSGWQQLPMEAALLGLTDRAQSALTQNCQLFNPGYRFRGMWGQIYDSIPDGDHGANILNTAQLMGFQTLGDRIFLLPAWPRDWNVAFKFHAPGATTVSGVYSNGVVQQLEVTPASRVNDVILMLTNVPVSAVGSATVTGYDAWRLSHYAGQDLADPSRWSPQADPDGDGLPNLIEYLMAGMDPAVPNPMPLPRAVQIGGQDYLQMQVLKNPQATSGTVAIQISDDLAAWTVPASSGNSDVIVTNDATQFTVQVRRSAAPTVFFRIIAQP